VREAASVAEFGAGTVARMWSYLEPTGPVARDALLPSDPGHALLLAQDLLTSPRMSNHSHGLWGYHGETERGRALTIQSTGIGGPSAAIVLRELRGLGVRSAVRVGGCLPLDPGLEDGELVIAARALTGDGTSAALSADGVTSPDQALTGRLRATAGSAARSGTVAGTDLLDGRALRTEGALVADLESAALMAVGRELGAAIGALLMVGPLDEEGARSLARIASAALAAERAQLV
jgi:uridine phosphorylase